MAIGDLSFGQKLGGGIIGGAGIGSGIGSLFGGGKDSNPADAAMPYFNQIPGRISPYLDPYINAGKGALPGYQDFLSKMLSNPGDFLNMLGKGYQKSPGFDWKMQQGQSAINNAGAAGGMLGTPQHQQQAGELANNLANQDYGEYMQRIMQALGLGQQGTAGLIGTGAGAAGSLADAIGSVLAQQGGLAYKGAAAENERKSGGIGNLLGGIAGIGSMFL